MDLKKINFGDRVAENEAAKLYEYFVETEQWNSLKNGDVDVVFGSKGAGKSALYTLALQNQEYFKAQNIILISAEKPTGATVFSDINTEPPTKEIEFVYLWKLYICQLIANYLKKSGHTDGEAQKAYEILVEAGLLEEQSTLKKMINKAMRFAKRLADVESIEAGPTAEGSFTGKITFRSPTDEQERAGYKSVDDLIDILANYLQQKNIKVWVLFDRLDVAFEQSLELEKNALRALFKTYRDIEEHVNLRFKIFLRDDVWKRITSDGFREASHITRTTTISWSDQNLMNLIISRALNNPDVIDRYKINKSEILSQYTQQETLYYKMLPKQIEIGGKQSDTFNWIKSRAKDGSNNIAPRELIHFYNESVKNEIKSIEIGNTQAEEPNILSRQSIKAAASEVSKVRTEQTLFAEYNDLRQFILKLENSKAEHNLETLSAIWETDQKSTEAVATRLAEIGFFESRTAKVEKLFKIPFLYRPYLSIVQGKAF